MPLARVLGTAVVVVIPVPGLGPLDLSLTHNLVPTLAGNPHHSATTVDLGGEVEVALARHHSEDATGQSGVDRVVLARDAGGVEIDVEVQANAAGALSHLDVGKLHGGLFDSCQLFVGEANALGVTHEAVVIEGDPTGYPCFPVPARAANAFGVFADGEAQLVVLPGWLGIGVLGSADGVPGVDAVAVGGAFSGYGLPVAGRHVDLRLHSNVPPLDQVGVCRRLLDWRKA